MARIDNFIGKYAFLSNTFASEVAFDGETYATVTHAFEASKTNDPHKRSVIRRASTPRLARSMGRGIHFRSNWWGDSESIMRSLILDKFTAYPDLKAKLICTGDLLLVEGTGDEDDRWGAHVYEKSGRDPMLLGQNKIGLILMEIRGAFRAVESTIGGAR